MTRRVLPVLVAAILFVPTDGLAQQVPWPFPGVPNPFLPAPSAPAPSAPATPGTAPAPVAATGGSPVVLELFTSRDCAACESAEYEVDHLLKDRQVPGVRLIALGFHVEFLGGTSTTDPYVLPASTRRQELYDSARGRVYTPQAIVDGDREFLGSEDATARSAITNAARQPKVSVEVTRAARWAGPTSLAISMRYGASPGRRPATITAVLAESGLLDIHHGGQTEYDRKPLAPVVRAVQEVGAASPAGGVAEATLAIPAGAVRANVTAVVLLQDSSNHHVLGVGTLPAGVL